MKGENFMKFKKSILQAGISVVLLFAIVFQMFSFSFALTDYKEMALFLQDTNEYYFSEGKLNNGFSYPASNILFLCGAEVEDYDAIKDAVYCIEPGIATSSYYTEDTKYLKSLTNKLTTVKEKETLLSLVLYHGELRGYWDGVSANATNYKPAYVATQLLLWEVITEDRDKNFNLKTNKVFNLTSNFTSTEKTKVKNLYNEIAENVKKSLVMPSFADKELELSFKDGVYTATTTDKNGVLKNCKVTSSNSDVKVKVSGNTLTLTSEKNVTEPVTLDVAKKYSHCGFKVYKGENDNTQHIIKAIKTESDYFKTLSLPNIVKPVTTGKIKIQKLPANPEFVKDNENYSLEGAEFEITSVADKSIKYYLKTDANGIATTENDVPFGEYKIKETVAPKGYMLNTDEFSVTLSKDSPVVETISVATVSIEEPVKSIRIRITKADKETETEAQGAATLNGAVFEIYDKDNNLVERLECGDHNFAISKALPFGTYKIKEVEAPKGYVLDSTEYTTTVKDCEELQFLVDAKIKNQVIKGNIEINKTKTCIDENNFFVDPTPFEGVKFIAKSNTTGIVYQPENPTTDENGKILFKDLPYDTYTILEETPEGYKENEEVIEITVSENGKTYIKNVVNETSTSILTLKKTTKDNLNINNISFNISGDTIDGRPYNKNVSTGSDGTYKIKVPFGTYTITELPCEANKYYIIPEAETIGITEDTVVEFYNEEAKGNLLVQKYLQGKDFEYTKGEGIVFNLSGVSYAGYECNSTVGTNTDGQIQFNNIPVGEYILTEIVTDVNKGYIISDPVKIVISQDTTTKLEVFNDMKVSQIKLIKTQKGTEDVFVAGAEYTLYNEDGSVYKTSTTDEAGMIKFFNVPYGKYTLKETKAPFGYSLNETEFSVNVTENTAVYTIETEDELILTDIKVKKTCKETGVALANTEFTLYNASSGEAIATVTTDKSGIAVFTDVAYGDYVIKETKAPEGYANDSENISFTVNDEYNDETVHSFENSPIAQTGFTSSSLLLLILTVGLFIFSVSFGQFWNIKKKEN